MRKVLFLLFLILSQSYILGNVNNISSSFRKELRLKNRKQFGAKFHRAPSAYVNDIFVEIGSDNIKFYFDNDNYKNINISVYYESSILYTNTFDHPTGTDISIQLPDEMEIGEYSVVIDNEKFDLIGYFVIEAE